MKNTASMARPTVTRLRPLHSHQQPPPRDHETRSSVTRGQDEGDPQLLHWSSTLEPRPDQNTAVKAFVKLVSRVIVLDPGETYCVQDSTRGGFILAHRVSGGHEAERGEEDGSFCFIDFADGRGMSTDFSIGGETALQLHVDAATSEVRLTAQASVIPRAALDSLGCMFDDLILGLQQGQSKACKWTQPSVLNVPPESRPPPLFPNEPVSLNGLQGDGSKLNGDEPAFLHRWFERQAAKHPERTALDFLTSLETGQRVQYSYMQVEKAANALAAALVRTLADSPSRPPVNTVAVLMGPCPELYVSYVAALKAGMAFCPIPVDAPDERKEALMVDLKPDVVLVAASTQLQQSSSTGAAAISVTQYLAADGVDLDVQSFPSSSASTENDVAYILYTSGTTGSPKGVAVSHLSATCTISALSAHYGFVPSAPSSSSRPTRWFQGAAPTFDISLFEIFWTLSTGSTLCCAPREFTLQDFDRVVSTLGADITNVTPSFASLLDPSSIRGLMLGGETVNTRLLRDFAPYNPTVKGSGPDGVPRGIYNGYGPTETAIYCIAQAHLPREQRGSVIGTPLATCGSLIVEETAQSRSQPLQLNPVPMGAVGELVITGPQVSRVGYFNRPNETAHAFVNDPRWGRAYRTGDRARIIWDSRGLPVVEFLGRISDDQVKLSGRRVELGEIESALASRVEEIRETLSCVWKRQDSEAGSEKVVSLVVPEPRAGLSFERVQQKCLEVARRHLPDYMRPFKVLQVDGLPKSASGKVDRRAASAYVRAILSERQPPGRTESTRLPSSEDSAPPLAPEDAKVEEELLSIVSGILSAGSAHSTTPIGANTPLAEAGMDSLHAMRLLRDVRNRWHTSGPTARRNQRARLQPSLALLLDSRASVRSVFFPAMLEVDGSQKADTKDAELPNRLAAFSARHMSYALDKLNLVSEAEVEMILPATSTQSQLVVSFAMNRRNYVSHTVLGLRSGVSAAALKKAIEVVISKQAIYRCAVLPCDDPLSPFAQVILAPEAWERRNDHDSRVVHRKTRAGCVVDDAKAWLDLAEERINLDSQTLYHIQIVESDSDAESTSNCSAQLVISVAHCICDGASLEVLVSDIAREYAGLDALPRQGIYEGVLEWAGSVDPETDRLWQESLRDWETESFGALSGDNVKSSSPGTDCECGMVQYASELTWHALEDRSRAIGASPLAILQAAWSLLLYLFSEADTGDVTFGSVISGQQLSAHAPTFSVVPCRVALPKLQTVGQLVGQLVEQSRFAQRHRHTSFGIFKTLPYNTALALQAYSPPHSTAGDCPAETVPVPWTEIRNPAMRYDIAVFAEVFPTDPHSPGRTGQFDSMTYKLTYREDTLSELSAACIARQLSALTEIMLCSLPGDMVQGLPARLPRSLLSAEGAMPVPSKSEEEKRQRDPDRLELLHSQFENQAVATPGRLALSFYSSLDSPPTQLTYAELDARANGLANILREEDADIIPICMQRSVELYVSVLAILKAGSAWCPIDETSPVQRRTSLIARTRSKLLLTSTDSVPLVQPCLVHKSLEGVRVILVDQYANHKASVRAEPRNSVCASRGLGGQNLAYLLWTSGTTGEPKGVMIQHAAATQAMRDLQIQVKHDQETEQVRTLQLSAYSFDVFVQDLFYTWGLAGSVISGTRELVLGTFVDFIWTASPTHAHLTPSLGASIAVDEIRGSTLQYVTFIGEKLTEDVAEAWAAPGITTCAYNTYGPAENAVVSTMRQFYGRSRDRAKAANVGFPLNPCTAYVVREVEISEDNQRCWELVPRYGVGELALGGAQVAMGYLGNEVKTAKAFIQGGPGIGERIYLTGDMVRLNDHGFEFLGRNDDLVKIAGIRIELSEISAACASIKDEEQAVEHVETLYLPRPGADANGSNKVVVTFVSVKQKGVDTIKIRAQIFQRATDMLPTYMVPGHVVVLDATMPRTASNKVDRKALQEIYKGSDLNVLAGRDDPSKSPGDGQQVTGEWNDRQLRVLRTIAENFKVDVEPLSPGDSLAGLGFSSLQITKLAWSLRRQLQCTVGVVDLMRCQFLGELVEVVLGKLPGQGEPVSRSKDEVPPETPAEKSWVASIRDVLTEKLRGDMRPHDTLHVLPSTPMQESLIVETMVEPRAYWSHRVFDLSHLGEVDGRRLEEAWTATARKFDILRTIFIPLTQLGLERTQKHDNNVTWAREQGIQSTILQLVRAKPSIRWTVLAVDEDQNLARWAEKLQVELAPLTTTQPPWAVTFAEGAGKVMLSMHHALYDNVTSGMVISATEKHYQEQAGDGDDAVVQFERGLELGLLPTGAQREEAASLWNGRLTELRKTAGSLNASFPDLTHSRQKQPQEILLSRGELPSALLKSTSASPDVSTLFQSAFGCVLAAYLELKTVVFGQTVSQRILHPDLARVVGPAIATLPVIVRADAPSALELWGDMSRDSSRLFQSTHHLHPVDIKKMLNQGSESSSNPFPGLFVYHPAPEDGEDVENVSRRHIFREVEQALSLNVEHPLALNIFEIDGTMELSGDARRISQAQLELMLKQIIEQARVMVESPQLPVNRLHHRMSQGLMSISGAAIEDEFRATDPTERFQQHASEHPEWIAAEEVIFQEEDKEEDKILTKSITYAQLDKLTNAIASRLASHEARLQPDDIVALYMRRDIMSLAATLAIFRAGYVYLPIDEDLPSARRRLLIHEAKARLVITTDKLYSGLDFNPDAEPPALLIPDGDDDVEEMLSRSSSREQFKADSQGGYLLYTSGSTGRPKGVRVSNSSLCHFITAFSTRMIESAPATANLGGTGKYLNLTSRAFDPHLTQLFVPLYLGHRVVIGRDRAAMLGSLQQVINELGITHFGSVPSVLTQLKLVPEDVPSVRVVTTGGEKASSELLNTWTNGCDSASQEGRQPVVLVNFYGPTEVTIGCLGHAVGHDSNARNLGLPFHGLEAFLLRPGIGDEQIVTMRGQPGELCIAGPQVAMGYLDRPVEDAKSFLTTSVLGGDVKRVYRTGDMMRMMHDGTLEFLGRVDQQAKIRGQRLELDEVVSFLKEAAAGEGDLDFAATVVANGNDSQNQQQQLFGFVARKRSRLLKGEVDAEVELLQNQGQALTSLLERLDKKCEAGLPAFMVPTLLWVSKIPYQAAAGKVDTKLLAKLVKDFFASQENQPDRAAATVAAGASHTLDPNESVVVASIAEAVGSQISATATSSVHRLGIDSLSAVHLLSLLRKRGFPTLSMTDILSPRCTVESIARSAGRTGHVVASQNWSATTSPQAGETDTRALSTADLGPLPVGLDESQIEAVLPSLPLQSALVARSLVWLSANGERSEDGAEVDVPYVAQFHYRLARGTDLTRWKAVAERVVASEAMLRTCFIQRDDDGRIFQAVLRSPPCSPFDGQGDPVDMVARMNVRPPIVMRVQETEGPGEAVVSIKIHHALFDGVAVEVLRKRLEETYNGLDSVPVSVNKSLGVLTSISRHCCPSDAQIESTRRLWQERLRGVQPCRVGAKSDDNNEGAIVRSTRCLAWTASQLKATLQAHSQQSGVSISVSSALQLATALCLAQLTRQTSVVYGFVMSLRPLLSHVADSVDDFVGPCLNTLVQTIRLERGDETLPELAQRVHESHLGACQGAMPLISVDKVQRWAESEDKLFDSVLNVSFVPEDEVTNDEPKPGCMHALHTRSKSDMALAIDVDLHADGKITLSLSSAGVLTESQLLDVGSLFEKVVCSSTDQNTRVEDLVLLHREWTAVASGDSHKPNDFESGPEISEEAYQEAFACVQTAVCRLLRLKPSEVSDKAKTATLYQMGIDSITVLPFVKIINKSENIKLAPNAVIKARTIQGVARLVQEAKNRVGANVNKVRKQDSAPETDGADDDVHHKTLGRLAKELMFIATPLQEGMLSASLAVTGRAYTYNHAIQLSEHALTTDSPSFSHFFAAVRDTVEACEILRTRFIFTKDDEAPWVGIVSPTEQSDLVEWAVVDSGTPGRIILKIHHALYDAASIQTIWHILDQNYRRHLQGHGQNDHKTSRYLFRPFARTTALAQRSSVAYWTDLVHDYSYTPLEFPDASLQASSAFHFTLKEQELSDLQTRCRALSVTVKAALQLAWVKVLCECLYGQADAVYGEVVSTSGGLDADGDDDEGGVVGPAINTVPMRAKLADQRTTASVAEALTQLQKLSDDTRGTKSMASLRKVQTSWRSSRRDEEHVPANLFQSLFVFDGVVTVAERDSEGATESLFRQAQLQTPRLGGDYNGGPAYDDYPLIVSFHIKNNTLHGKLRGKLTGAEVDSLGNQLEAAVKHVVSCELQSPVLDFGKMVTARKESSTANRRAAVKTADGGETEDLAPTADAVLDAIKAVLGTRCRGKDIGHQTRLINVGLDSILAIRVSRVLKKQMGIDATVFDLIKGASVHDIVKSATLKQKVVVQEQGQRPPVSEDGWESLAAERLRLPRNLIKSVQPVLAGQRAHLEQWLYNGKRFFEAPWVYRVVDDSVDLQKVASCWSALCRSHEALRTTFVWLGDAAGLAQVTLAEQWTGERRFAALRDVSKPIQALMEEHVAEENGKVSNLREPPARLTFLEASDGKAVVLRVHHALYDAWSIKIIENDLNELLASGKAVQKRASFQSVVRQIRDVRQPDAEDLYWKRHLLHAQETVLHAGVPSPATRQSPLGSHFKANYAAIAPRSTIDVLWQTKSNARTSAAIILAYARTLGHFTCRSRPTFGLNHASRSLSSVDGPQTLDLTAASVPTLTVTPFCVDLEGERSGSPSDELLLDFVQEHLAQLTKFAQWDEAQSFGPRFNSYLNILYPGDHAGNVGDENVEATVKVLSRHKLSEPLASDYFTVASPSPSTVSTVEGLRTSHLCPHRFFFNVIVRHGQDVSVSVSGDEALHDGDPAMVTQLVSHFGAELAKIVQGWYPA